MLDMKRREFIALLGDAGDRIFEQQIARRSQTVGRCVPLGPANKRLRRRAKRHH